MLNYLVQHTIYTRWRASFLPESPTCSRSCSRVIARARIAAASIPWEDQEDSDTFIEPAEDSLDCEHEFGEEDADIFAKRGTVGLKQRKSELEALEAREAREARK